VCLIQNSYFPKRDESDKSGSGIGLQNLQRRLALLYNGHYTFESKLKGDSYESFLMLELKPNED
jgi:sensor histidine kinase YesM